MTLLSLFLSRYKDQVAAEVEKRLSYIGEDRIRFLVENDIPLWDDLPNKDKDELVSRALPHASFIRDIDVNELASTILRYLAETNSRFAFIPHPWLVNSLREARVEILKTLPEPLKPLQGRILKPVQVRKIPRV